MWMYVLVVVAVLMYVPYSLLRAGLGVDYVLEPLGNQSCQQLRTPGMEACDALALHQTAGLVYMACGNLEQRKSWFPTAFALTKPATEQRESIYMLSLDTKDISKLELEGLEHELVVHGMDIHVMENGVTRLFVVNHAYSGDVVELFDHVIGSTILQWKETVRDPLFKSLNGLASLGPRAFYVTNDFDSDHARDPWKRGMDLVMPSNQSSVVHWNGEGRRVASGFAFANGIVVSNDGTRVVVAEMVGQRLSVLERDNVTNDLTLAKRLDTHMSIDNMSKDVQGNIYVTAQPSLYKVLLFQLGYSKSVPSILLQLKKDYSLSEFYRDDGDMTSVSTHAVVDHQRRLFVVGSFYDTCVALCSM